MTDQATRCGTSAKPALERFSFEMCSRLPSLPAAGCARHADGENHGPTPMSARRSGPAIGTRAADASGEHAFDALCRHAMGCGFGAETSRVRGMLESGPVAFRDVVEALGSRVAARFAVLRLAGDGTCDVDPIGPLTDRTRVAIRRPARTGRRA